jgi:hypothetical protein
MPPGFWCCVPAAAARFSETAVATCSLTPQAIRRLRAWQTLAL